MSTKVKQTYRAGEGLSVTKRGGRITKVTVWTLGVPGSTQRVETSR